MGQGYELNIFKNGRKGGHFWGARSPLPLLLGNVLQPICGPIVFIRNPSIFSLSVGVFYKLKASGVSLGSRGEGYELNIFENGRKGGHFGGVRSRAVFTI